MQPLGSAGNAELYRGLWCPGPGTAEQMCVVKRLGAELGRSPTFVRMFEEEARILAQLDHPAIVRTFDSGSCDGVPYVVLEWLDGRDLYRVLKSLRQQGRPGLPVEVAIYVARQVALALAHAHAAHDQDGQPLHLVHRDIRPDNITVLRDGRVKLGEFGVARASSFISLSITLAGISRTKPVYLAPEQVSGGPLDARADLFSLGVVLWEMLTGRPLFPPTSPREAAARVLKADLPRPSSIESEVPPELDALVMRLLERAPGKRLQSAMDLAQRLGAMLPVPADAVRGLAVLVRACVDTDTPTPVPVGGARAHSFTLALPGLTAALASIRDSIRRRLSFGDQAGHPAVHDPAEPITEVDLQPAGLAHQPQSSAGHLPPPTGLVRRPRRRRLVSLLRIAARERVLLTFGRIWQRLRSLRGLRP
jgi:serine/threonine protein kinase